jgi:hypothetical protein
MSLSEKLEAIRESSHAKYGVEVDETMRRAEEELRQSGIMERALNVGDVAPAFNLPNQDGELVRSGELLKRGALVVTFYRGVW